MQFSDLDLSSELEGILDDRGYQTLTEIQEKSFASIASGKDFFGISPTGTGKTAAFLLPFIDRKIKGDLKKQVIIFSTTRELARQTDEFIKSYSEDTKIKTALICGGFELEDQKTQLADNPDFISATPGRFRDLLEVDAIDFTNAGVVIFDEIQRLDQMEIQIEELIGAVPDDAQKLFFSAVKSVRVEELVAEYMNDPAVEEVTLQDALSENIEQTCYRVKKSKKRDWLSYLLKKYKWTQVMVFTRSKFNTKRLARQLFDEGYKVATVFGNKSQETRFGALQDFKDGNCQVLVTTDIAAYGIDIKNLPCVINFDFPETSEDYVNRMGRTGRAGAFGEAVTLVSEEEMEFLEGIEEQLNIKIKTYKPSENILGKRDKKKRKNRDRNNKTKKRTASRKENAESKDPDAWWNKKRNRPSK